jgi:hypothetical protein
MLFSLYDISSGVTGQPAAESIRNFTCLFHTPWRIAYQDLGKIHPADAELALFTTCTARSYRFPHTFMRYLFIYMAI